MNKLFASVTFLCFALLGYGQEQSSHADCSKDISAVQSFYSISFGEAIEAGVSDEHEVSVFWSVSPQEGVSKTSGAGKSTGDLVFSKPGTYQIAFQIPAHFGHPAKKEIVTVEVSDVRMMFDTKNVTFSKPLTTGSASGITMTVPVQVKTYNGKAYSYTAREVQTTGTARVSSRLKDGKAELKNGENQLAFELSGTVPAQGHIQFRVYDTTGTPAFINYSISQ